MEIRKKEGKEKFPYELTIFYFYFYPTSPLSSYII